MTNPSIEPSVLAAVCDPSNIADSMKMSFDTSTGQPYDRLAQPSVAIQGVHFDPMKPV